MSVILKTLLRGSSALNCRNIHVSSAVQSDAFKKLSFALDGYNKMGLYHDDLLNEEFCEHVQEAVRRLPENLRLERIHRHIRAHQLEVNHTILPKEMWTKFEDPNHYYLQPYLAEVIKESKERAEWDANH